MSVVATSIASTSDFDTARLRGLAARYEAQKIAFAPVVFQCVRLAWKSGLLAGIEAAGKDGIDIAGLAEACDVGEYAASVLLETALSAGVVRRVDGRYTLTRIGDNVLHDRLTQINIDYNHDVCYQGLFRLEESLRTGKPAGLAGFGDWPTIYAGLSELPEPARSSWFAFDHHYSDSAFGDALPIVFANRPRHLMDIGANTGKWSQRCLRHDAEVRLTLVDLPMQLQQAEAALAAEGLLERACLAPIDLLDSQQPFPTGCDAIWMSQFLTCFSVAQVGGIFHRAAAALADGGTVWVLDTFWDRMPHEIARYCVINTSPYFTALANGTSKMHESPTIIECAARQGLRLTQCHDGLGICHSLLGFERA